MILKENNINLIKNKYQEVILGLGLGLGYMTSLRFFGKVGISELLILTFILLMFFKYKTGLFKFEKTLPGIIKLYTFISIFIIMPTVTMYVYFYTNYNSTPIYIISFMMGWLIAFLLVLAQKDNFDMKLVIFVYAISFIATNLFGYFFMPRYYAPTRFMSFCNDPNQLMFYISNLSLMLAIYNKKLLFIFLPILVWLGYKSGSDSYSLQLFAIMILFIVYYLLFNYNLEFKKKLFIAIVLFSIILLICMYFFSDKIIEVWRMADGNGSNRLGLFYNAFLVSLDSPIFGFGAGSFSGRDFPYSFWEAHNTFLDFSMQFGFLFPTLIYIVLFGFLLKKLSERSFLEAAFITAFIISGLFHYNGRHFIFWVELAVFYHYIFYVNLNSKKI